KTQPYDVSRIRRNTIGADTWGQPGMSVSYDVTVDQAGLYLLSLKYRQDLCRDRSTYRTIYVNGELQNSAFREIPFEYDIKWNIKTVSDGDAPAYLFLKQGTNRITLEVTAGQIGSLLQKVESINMELSRVYRKIIMITGTSPDKFRDFNLEREIPGLVESIESIAARLDAVIAEYTAFGKSNSSYLFQLRKISSQLRELAKEPQTIPERLKVFRDDINALSNWLLDSTLQSLELDYLVVHSAGQPLPSPRATVWESAAHNVRAFLASFVSDYNSFSTEEEKTPQSITIWSGEGRDQAQMLKTLVEDSFIPQTGIQVNLSLVTQGFIEASLAGRNPDISIGVARGQPVNLACRNALEDLSHFDTFDEVVARFIPGATVPYQYNGKTYALPNKQSYFMMYYRMDIFEELGLSIPNTWEDVYQLIPVLQRKNMEIGFPYTVLTSAGSIDLGMGSKDMFPCFLMQSGGQFYNDQQTGVALDTPQAMAAFKKWTDFYTKYSFSTAYSYYERFRSGQMPLMIQNLGAYGMFAAAAPEIRNLWAIAPIPGTVQPDGSIDRTVASEGTATVMFKNAQNKEACWDFLDWWMRAETQSSYALSMENL
ncbi:MAG: extracellular solute-binding protein, partial [Angelakisella sp.]